MISVAGVIIISVLWIVLVGVLFRILGKGKDSLGAFFMCLMTMFIPILIFVFTNIMCWIYGVNETVYSVIMIILISIFVGLPVLYLIGRFLYLLFRYPPKRAAVYARKKVGGFNNFSKEKWGSAGYRSAVHSHEPAYLAAQILVIWKKLGAVYRMRPRSGKKRYIRAIMELNLKDLPQIRKWEYHTILDGLYQAETDVLLHFTDGEKAVVFLNWPKRIFTTDELTEEDQKKIAYRERFRQITMTGRLIYIFMCIERYLVSLYPGRDWTPVAERMWNRTKSCEGWDEGTPGDLYREIVPERIMRFYRHGYGYEKLNPMVFDRKLSPEDYTEIRKLYEGISRGDPEEEINQMVGIPEQLIYKVNLRNHDPDFADQMTVEMIMKAESILKKREIQLPDASRIEGYSFERHGDPIGKEETNAAFGFGVDAADLSIILTVGRASGKPLEERKEERENDKKRSGYGEFQKGI